MLVESSPFGVGSGGREPPIVAFAMVALNIVLAMITFLASLWAKRFYARKEIKLIRARQRYSDAATLRRLRRRFEDVGGGVPSLPAAMGLRMEIVGGRLEMRRESASEQSAGEDP